VTFRKVTLIAAAVVGSLPAATPFWWLWPEGTAVGRPDLVALAMSPFAVVGLVNHFLRSDGAALSLLVTAAAFFYPALPDRAVVDGSGLSRSHAGGLFLTWVFVQLAGASVTSATASLMVGCEAPPPPAPRPAEVIGDGFAGCGLPALHSADPPYDRFPSHPVAHSYASALPPYRVHRPLGVFSTICAMPVPVSTLFTNTARAGGRQTGRFSSSKHEDDELKGSLDRVYGGGAVDSPHPGTADGGGR